MELQQGANGTKSQNRKDGVQLKSTHIQKKIEVYTQEAKKHLEALLELVKSQKYIRNDRRQDIYTILEKYHWTFLDYEYLYMFCRVDPELYLEDHPELKEEGDVSSRIISIRDEYFNRILPHIEFLHAYHDCNEGQDRYSEYLDSPKRFFRGDIIITDPCYIIRAEQHGTTPIYKDDWDACNYGENMEALGIYNYLTHGTLYGDWSCTTFNKITKEPIGDFCADAGLVSVFSLDEVLKYNPDFDWHTSRPWTTTWIKDFDGSVQIVIKYRAKGSKIDVYNNNDYMLYDCHVVGSGVNMKTGEPIQFITRQTGI